MPTRGPITEEERRRQDNQARAQRITQTRESVTGLPRTLMTNAAAAVAAPFGVQPFQGAQLPEFRTGRTPGWGEQQQQQQPVGMSPREQRAALPAPAPVANFEGGIQAMTRDAVSRPATGAAAVAEPTASAVNTRNMNRGFPTQPMAGARDFDAEVDQSLRMMTPLNLQLQEERGVYNDQNTDLGALAARAAPTAGINFGFGDPGRQSLGDLQARQAQTQRERAEQRLRNQMEAERLRTSADQTIGQRAASRRRMASLQGELDSLTGANVSREGLANEVGIAGINAGATQSAAATRAAATEASGRAAAESRLMAAQLGAEATLGAAGIRAEGQAGTQANQFAQAAQRQAQLQFAMALIQDAEAQGVEPPREAIALLLGQQARPDQVIMGGMENMPMGVNTTQGIRALTPDQQAIFDQYRMLGAR